MRLRSHPVIGFCSRAVSTWFGQLIPNSSGNATKPIVFARYGKGPRPKIDGGGKVEDVVRIYNLHDLELRDFELTNHGAAPAIRRGVHIFLEIMARRSTFSYLAYIFTMSTA